MRAKLDYLAARLTDYFDYMKFLQWSEIPIVGTDGEVEGVILPPSRFSVDTYGYNRVVRTYKAGQFAFAELVNEFELPVVRLDLALDIDPQPGYTALEVGAYYAKLIDQFYTQAKRRITRQHWKGFDNYGNPTETWSFGSNGSEYKIRVYSKFSQKGEEFGWLRIEFQLRKSLAKSVWNLVRTNIYSQSLLRTAIASLEKRLLKEGLLRLNISSETVELSREIEIPTSNRKSWILTSVLSACVKHWNEEAENLPELLLNEFNLHFERLGQKNAQYSQLSERAQEALNLLEED